VKVQNNKMWEGRRGGKLRGEGEKLMGMPETSGEGVTDNGREKASVENPTGGESPSGGGGSRGGGAKRFIEAKRV